MTPTVRGSGRSTALRTSSGAADGRPPAAPPRAWRLPPSTARLPWNEAHVWWTELPRWTTSASRLAALEDVLGDVERARADGYASPTERDRFVAARALLRVLLGRYLGVEPRHLALATGPFGKPTLDPGRAGVALEFNVSHSGDVALFAFARGGRIGVDVEARRAVPEALTIARSHFSQREAAALTAMRGETRERAFLGAWTRKEAWLKALGDGLSRPLVEVEVPMCALARAATLHLRDAPTSAPRWRVEPLPAGPRFAAAVAVEGGARRTRCFRGPRPPPRGVRAASARRSRGSA